MKKIIFTLMCACFALTGVSAQETKQYLPEAGDYALSVNLKPVLECIGGLLDEDAGMSGDVMNPTYSFAGKYMLTDNLAVRANVGLNINSYTDRNYVRDDAAYFLDPLSEDKVIDACTSKNNGVRFKAGVEYRVGKNRVQGVFGADLMFAYNNYSAEYAYGNAMTELNQHPTSYYIYDYIRDDAYRTLKNWNSSADLYGGLALTAGVEWFVAPKVALGFEASLYGYYQHGNQSYSELEWYNVVTEKVETWTELVSPGDRGFKVATGNFGANLYMTFYF